MSSTLVHVLDSICDEAAGPSYSVPRLCAALGAQGATVRLFTVDGQQLLFSGFEHEAYPADFARVPGLNQLHFSSALKRALVRASKASIILHTHGLWRMPNVYPAFAAQKTRTRLVLSPRGMLGQAALEFSKWEKKLFWAFLQGGAARAASCLHATSLQEYEEVRAFGLTAPVAIIPNGIDLGPAAPKGSPRVGNRTVLYLGRLHPKKGLDGLLDAWELIEHRHGDWQLDIVGPIDSDYAQMLKARIAAGATARVRLVGPLYGDDKIKAYQRAHLFVLPTLNENFAMTVAEALVQGTPVISTKGAPWADLVSHGCGWWINHGTEPLAASMDEAMSLSGERLASMGEAGRAWMRRDFDWSKIAGSMRSVYAWLCGRGERPSCVVLD